MRKVLFCLAASLLSFACFSQTWVKLEEAPLHTGQTVNLLGLVTRAEYLKDKALMLLTCKKADKTILLICADKALVANKNKEAAYINQYVQVKGLIQMSNGKPWIQVVNSKQLSIVREAPKGYDGFEPE